MCACKTKAEKIEDLCGYCLEEYYEWLDKENSLREEIAAYEAEVLADKLERKSA